jgi:hypothetical protein
MEPVRLHGVDTIFGSHNSRSTTTVLNAFSDSPNYSDRMHFLEHFGCDTNLLPDFVSIVFTADCRRDGNTRGSASYRCSWSRCWRRSEPLSARFRGGSRQSSLVSVAVGVTWSGGEQWQWSRNVISGDLMLFLLPLCGQTFEHNV